MMEKFVMIGLEIVFLVVCWLIGDYLPTLGNWFFPLLGIAAFRGGRAIAFNEVFKWLRDIFGVVVSADPSGAGHVTVATGNGAKLSLGQLVTCPICSGTWFGLALLAIWTLHPGMGRALIYVMAAAGVAELLHWLSEYLGWGGRLYREQSGSEFIEKNGNRLPMRRDKNILNKKGQRQ
jgi:hypothetical protein